MLSKGMLITFEGIGGTGKSTQCDILFQYLKNQLNLDVIKTSEPTPCNESNSWYISEQFVSFIKKSEFEDPMSDLFMMLAIRNEHCKKLIIPALKEKKVVLCDRFVDSMFAYQGYGFGIDLALIKQLNELVCRFDDSSPIEPDITFVLDRDSWESVASNRVSHKDKFRKIMEKDRNFLKKVRDGFLKLSEDNPRCHRIDSSGSIDQSSMEIVDIVMKRIEHLNAKGN